MKTIIKLIVAPFKVAAIFITILLMLITASILILAAMFATRAAQPMNRPEFGGLTYFEYIEYREWAQQQNPLMVSMQTQYPLEDLSCAGFDRYDDVLLTGIGIYQAQGNLTNAWIFFEDSLIQVDLKKNGLRFGREIGCDLPLSPSIAVWKNIQEASKESVE